MEDKSIEQFSLFIYKLLGYIQFRIFGHRVSTRQSEFKKNKQTNDNKNYKR